MTRDGFNESIWQASSASYQPVNSWSPETTYDVLIIGAGITGVTTALLLQSQGLKCIIAEAHNVCFGTTGGTTAHLNTVLDTPYNQVEHDFGCDAARILRQGCAEAIDLVENLSLNYCIDCGYSSQAAYLIARDEQEADELEKIVDAAQRAGDEVSYQTEIPVPISFQKAARVEGQAQIHAVRYVTGIAKAYEDGGGVILTHCVVESLTSDNGVFQAESSVGSIKTHKVIYATHIPPGINILHFRCVRFRENGTT